MMSLSVKETGNDSLMTIWNPTRSVSYRCSLVEAPVYKMFEYMAMKLPVVSTSLGAEGLGVRDEEHLLIRDDDQTFADALIRLCESETKRQQLSSQAYELVCSQFSSEAIGEQFEECCLRAVDNWKAKQG